MDDLAVILLAAGKGTRMAGSLPKVLKNIAGKPIIIWDLELIRKVGIKEIVVVIGHGARLVKRKILEGGYSPKFILEKKLKGTGYAAKIGLQKILKDMKDILILYGDDSALYKPETLIKFINFHKKNKNNISIVVTERKGFSSVGGLKVDRFRKIIGILQTSEILQNNSQKIKILCGALCFNKKWLSENLNNIKPSKVSGEYPLPSLINIASNTGYYAKAFYLKDSREWNSVNTYQELKEAERKKILLQNGS